MRITLQNVAFYLAERRLLTIDSVVDGDFMVMDQSSRNRNFKIVRQKSPGFFIKQVRSQTPHYTQTLEREAACYQLAQSDHRFAGLAALLPRCHHYDSANHILILEMLSDARTLWEHHSQMRGFPLETAELQGQCLGACHRQTEIPERRLAQLKPFPRQIPWILSILESNPHYLSQMSRGNSQLIGILQQYPEFPAALKKIRAGWAFRALIHGDIKWENLILKGDPENGSGSLKVIDWEMADIGDECWDAGAIFQAYLSFWIFSLPLGPGTSLEDATRASPFDSEGMQPAMAAFWSSYARRRGLEGEEAQQLLERCMMCAAARMIQTAYEGIQQSPDITPHAICQLQMSMNILRDPQAAIRNFLESQPRSELV